MFFDSHAHYDDEKFDNDRYELLGDMKKNDVSYILNAGCDIETSQNSIRLADKYDFIYAAVGIHPHDVQDMTEEDIRRLRNFTKHPKVVAIGEIGLDYYYDNSERDLQKYWFRRQIQLANELQLPFIIHDRDAHGDCMDIVKSEPISPASGIFHCYSGSVEMVKTILNMGLYISVGGTVTFKNSVRIKEVVKYVPMDRILLETDCPYLTPEPHRGKRNDSTYLKYTAAKISEIKGITVDKVANITMENAKQLFNI